MDKSRRQRALQCSIGIELKIRHELLVDLGCLSIRRALDQIRPALSCTRLHHVLFVRSDRATKDSSVPISNGRRGALLVLFAAALNFRVYWIRLRLSHRSHCIDIVDHMVLSILPRRWRADVDDRRRAGGRLHLPLHHAAATGLRVAHGGDRALLRARDGDVCDAKGRLVRARRGIVDVDLFAIRHVAANAREALSQLAG